MPEKKVRFALFGKQYEPKYHDPVQRTFDFLSEHDAEIHVDRHFFESVKGDDRLKIKLDDVFDGEEFDADYAISLGGDGTFLRASNRVGLKGIPIIGVNMGTLGFLADVSPCDIEKTLGAILDKEFYIENHSVVQVDADSDLVCRNPYGLNEVAVLKRDDAAMITVHVEIDNSYLGTYRADGLIIATPTGSTAYNLSNGGPIMIPQARNFCLTPVAPHSLSVRPIVVSDSSVITMTVESRSHSYLVAVDGRSVPLRESGKITVRKAGHSIRFIKCLEGKYFSILREKMMWGADNRE